MAEIVVDACCFINVCASRRVRSLLRDSGFVWHVPRIVISEAAYLRARDEQGEVVRVPIDARSLLDDGLAVQNDVVEGEETGLYVRLAVDLDDGEAAALTMAKQRGWILATDDRKARRFAKDLGVTNLTTPEILRRWSQVTKPSPAEVAEALRSIEFGARFVPASHMPGYDWWVKCLKAS